MKKDITIGMDLGDKLHQICILSGDGTTTENVSIGNTDKQIEKFFKKYSGATIAIEAGTHSPWISRQLQRLGLTVLVGNPRSLRMIWNTPNKSDVRDAEMLARIARFDPKLLNPIYHRSESAQADLQIIKSRDALVNSRAALINHVRGAVKSIGKRISSCSSDTFYKKAKFEMPQILAQALEPVIETIGRLTAQIHSYERKIERVSEEKYPETLKLREIHGVGPVTSLAFVLTIEDPNRFDKSRTIGAYLGLVPKRDQSGRSDKQLKITKAGDNYLRRLLVTCSNFIMGSFGKESDLRNFGMKIQLRGGKKTKQISKVAVARKLAVVMHSIWKNGTTYVPLQSNAA